MEIRILGYDCPNCDKLYQRALRAIKQLRFDATVKQVNNPEDVWSYGLVTPPTLVVDGNIVSQGKMLTVAELKKLLRQLCESSSPVQEGTL